MFYFIFSIIAGLLLSLSPVFLPESSIEIYPEWYASTETNVAEDYNSSIDQIQSSPDKSISGITLKPIVTNSKIYLLNGNGVLLSKTDIDDYLISISQNGKYYIRYEKIGTSIELLNTNGDRFWRIKSRE